MKVTFPITEREYLRFADRIKEHQANGPGSGRAGAPAHPRRRQPYPHPGRFYVANRQVDRQTGTILMQALFPNPDGILRPGLYAKVRAPTETVRGALLVPAARACRRPRARTRSRSSDADDKVAFRTVKPGEQVDGLWVVD